jgi:hypothetical protein
VLRQLLAWERDLAGSAEGLFDDRIYVLTPQASIVELPQGATPVDFAYSVHTNLGHRCRGARVDGAMVPLNTPLHNGQTVEIVAAKEGGPSRDWLNTELGFLASHRARPRCAPGSTSRCGTRPWRAGASWWKAAAARGPHGHQAGGPGFAARVQVRRRPVLRGRQGRVLAAQHRDAAASAARRAAPDEACC